MNNILEVNNVVKQYGDYTALNSVSLQVPKGSIYGLLGPNGAGKTSLIRIINQITMPDKGEVFLDGEKLAPHHVSYIGYMPEERGLYKTMKVGEQALYLAQLKGMPHAEAKKQLKYWFEKFGIEGWWNKKIQELSKGMAQKIQFIVTILHDPKVLFLDEPTVGVDVQSKNVIINFLKELNTKGTTIIYTSHHLTEAQDFCNKIAIIDRGTIFAEGKVSDVKKEYRTHKFQVGILSDNVEGLMYDLTQKFTVGKTTFKSLNNDLKLEIDLGHKTQNELLEVLIKNGQVTHFAENIPSINDIFIQTVTNKK
ncbi:ABC transporter ATP-binding protein [Flavobacterium columnare]|uniref:ABC transporter ATP-binding protein n=1 Tax=Flavobacterium columnare TaxID=996 RepID=UPI001BC892FA|nr:ATP-binding cassette domain-containing protein [Flavobacterium columnare]AUX17093.1 ABC transporter ATP-binding protein [Flavobacterium columnare]